MLMDQLKNKKFYKVFYCITLQCIDNEFLTLLQNFRIDKNIIYKNLSLS